MSQTTQRALRLLALLQSRPVWTAAELAGRLGVTTRRIRRDVQRLRELGYPVNAAQGAGGGYQLGQGTALPPLLLDDEEAVAVAVSLRLAAGGTVAGASEAAVRTMAKLDQVMPARLRSEVRALQDSIATLQMPGALVDGDLLLTLARACRDTVRVTFGYTAADGTTTSRRVEPYRLVVVGPRWYLFGYDLDRDDWRTFRLDRLADLVAGTWRFTPRAHDDPASYVQRSVVSSPYRWTARVRVGAPHDEVAARVGPRAAAVERLDDGTALVTAGADDLELLALHLSLLGGEVTVLDPPELRTAMAGLGERLLAAAVRDNGGHEDEQAGGVQ